MMDIIMKIWFFIVILPYLMAVKGYEMLNDYLEKKGRSKIEMPYVLLFLLVLLLLILWGIGYR
jgi:hypothetical protein